MGVGGVEVERWEWKSGDGRVGWVEERKSGGVWKNGGVWRKSEEEGEGLKVWCGRRKVRVVPKTTTAPHTL